MASRTVVFLEDDLDGSEATQTVSFSYDGVDYEIDLSQKNAEKLRKLIGPYTSSGRRVGGRKRSTPRQARRSSAVDNRTVREWAETQGIAVSSRGRVAASVLEKYRAAGN